MNAKKESKGIELIRKTWSNMKVQKIIVIITFLFVPLILLVSFTYLPFFKMVEFSFYDMGYIGTREWVGLDNYAQVFTRDDCLNSLKLSGYYLLGSVVQIAVALLFATILSFKPKGSSFFRAALFFPTLICGISVGFIFKYFYTHGSVLDSIIQLFDVPLDSIPFWLRDTKINNWVLVISSIWRYMGQNMILFIGAIVSVDKTQFDAAAIDGANAWHRFRYIILPSIKTIVVINMILAVSGALSVFEIPYVITNGGFGTSTYFVLMDKLAHFNQKVGLASAMAVVLLTFIIAVGIIQKMVQKHMDKSSPIISSGKRRKSK